MDRFCVAAVSLFVEGAAVVYEAFVKRAVVRWKAGCVALLSVAVGVVAVIGAVACDAHVRRAEYE